MGPRLIDYNSDSTIVVDVQEIFIISMIVTRFDECITTIANDTIGS